MVELNNVHDIEQNLQLAVIIGDFKICQDRLLLLKQNFT